MDSNKIEVLLTPSHAGVSVKLTRSTQGTSLEVDVNRLKTPDETYDECALDAARIAADTYAIAERRAAVMGLTIGKDPK